MKKFLFFLLSITSAAFAESQVMVTITSVYKNNLVPAENITVKGSGFIVEDLTRKYVITASHVGSGQDSQIFYQGKKLKVLGDLYEGRKDLQIFEIEKSVNSASMKIQNGYIEWLPENNIRFKYADRFNFTLLNDWVYDPNLEADNAYLKNLKDALSCDLFCVLMTSNTLMQPGSSGSPLITKLGLNEWSKSDPLLPYDVREFLPEKARGLYIVRGMSIKRDRFFAKSSFIPVRDILNLIKNYVDGKRVKKEDMSYVWNMAGSLMYRTGKNFSESSAVFSSVGNGVSMDGGNIASFNEDNPVKALEKISTFPKFGNREEQYWYFYYNGPAPTYYIMMVGPVWFSAEHRAAFHNESRGDWMAPTENIGYTTASVYENLFHFLAKKLPLLGDEKTLKMSDWGWNESWKSPYKAIEVNVPTKDKSSLRFYLISGGGICETQKTEECHKRFEPVSEIKDSRGVTYIVDLRDLIFLNPENLKTNAFRQKIQYDLSADALQTKNAEATVEEYRKLKIYFRKKRKLDTPLKVEEGQVESFVWLPKKV
jgi:hypothetical protein